MHCHFHEVDGEHWTASCPDVRAMPYKQRKEWVKKKKLHQRCLDKHADGECHVPE